MSTAGEALNIEITNPAERITQGGVTMAGEQNVLHGKWNEMKGNVRQWFGKLTDDDIEEAKGNRDKLIGKLEQRYGWSRMQAEQELDRHMNEYERTHTSSTY